MPFPFHGKKGADAQDNKISLGDLEPELQSKPTMASMQEEYSKQNSELNDSSIQHSEEVLRYNF